MITGEYNQIGYTVFSDSTPIYSAGNSPDDSQAYDTPGIGLRLLRSYCIKTAMEIAAERNELFGGVERSEAVYA